MVVDGLMGLEATPPALFDLDPTPLLLHARDSGEEPLQGGSQRRRLGWARLVLFVNCLRPAPLEVRGTGAALAGGFRKGVRRAQAGFGLYPFAWREGWQKGAEGLMGGDAPKLQVAPVLERLVFPRARSTYLRWLVPAHYSAPIACGPGDIRAFRERSEQRQWAPSEGSWAFLAGLDVRIVELGLIPDDPEGGGSGR